MRKKITTVSIVLIAVMLSPLLCYIGFLLQQKLVQQSMSEHLQHEKLAIVKIKKSEVNWIKTNKEVIIEGKLFDIKNLKAEGEYLILYGLFDHEEDLVQMKLNHLLPLRKKAETPIYLSVLRLFATPFLIAEITTPILFATLISTTHKMGNFSIYISEFVSVISPPPKCI